jgi:hypothetical protein
VADQEFRPDSGEDNSILPRGVMFLFRYASAEMLIRSIERFGAARRSRRPGHPPVVSTFGFIPGHDFFWTYPPGSSPLLEFHLLDIDEWEIDLEASVLVTWWLPFKSALKAEPTIALAVGAAEGQAAEDALVRFAAGVLKKHAGIVQDDNSNHAWTLNEIRAGLSQDGYRFFQTRHLETHP